MIMHKSRALLAAQRADRLEIVIQDDTGRIRQFTVCAATPISVLRQWATAAASASFTVDLCSRTT